MDFGAANYVLSSKLSETLIQFQSPHDPNLNYQLLQFRDYFSNTWLAGNFPILIWNHWGNDGPRTTNHAEGYHNR